VVGLKGDEGGECQAGEFGGRRWDVQYISSRGVMLCVL
jgi:hypothetical protein